MIKAAWMTDIHLNFLADTLRQIFYKQLNNNADIAFITGDIAEATSVVKILEEMAASFKKPIYFVCGNHDFYDGSVVQVRENLQAMCKKSMNTKGQLLYMTQCGAIHTGKTIIVGVDGFADSREGDFYASKVKMNDHFYIEDYYNQCDLGQSPLVWHDMNVRAKIAAKMKQLADDDALNLEYQIRNALESNPEINRCIVLTHIPPFKENALHQGKPSGSDHLSFYVSKATGDVLLKVAEDYPSVEFDVYCGHSHSHSLHKHTENLLVECGAAKYMSPQIQKLIEISND